MCSDIRGIRKRHPFSYAVQLTWKDQWLIYSAAWHVSFLFTPSSIFFKVELGVLCSVLKEFQTCGVSSATDVAQLDTCILENTTVSKKIVSVGWRVSLLVPWIWRNLRCLVYFCPTGKKCHLRSIFKQLVWRRFCLNFVFQCMQPWKFWKGNCCVCSPRYRGFLLIVLSIKLERIFFED